MHYIIAWHAIHACKRCTACATALYSMRNSHKSLVYLVQNADILGLLCRSRTLQANPAARLARVASRLHITLTHLPCSSRPLQHCTRLPLHGLLRGPIDSLPLPMINDLQSSKLQACCISLSHTFPAHDAHSSIARGFPAAGCRIMTLTHFFCR